MPFIHLLQLVQDVPSEDCVLLPGKMCSIDLFLLPTLEATESCIQVPKEICTVARKNPTTIRTPKIKRTCANDEVRGAVK